MGNDHTVESKPKEVKKELKEEVKEERKEEGKEERKDERKEEGKEKAEDCIKENNSISVNATRANALKVYTSLGIGNQVISFLDRSEIVTGQILNKFAYHSALGRG